MESDLQLTLQTKDERVYWITYTGESKHGLIDTMVVVYVRKDGAVEFMNGYGGETVTLQLEQVENLKRLLMDLEQEGINNARTIKRTRRNRKD